MSKFVIFLLVFSLKSFGMRNFDSIRIPGAVCGDGSDYRVFIESRSNKNWAFKIQGGGACWNHFTCFRLGTTRGRIPERSNDNEGFASANPADSPVADASFVLFPYCTGDVHLGTHTAQYGDRLYEHRGKENIEQALRYLQEEGYVAFSAIENFVLYGESAGAIGALYHTRSIAPYLPARAKKHVILDAPGLHFGPSFWDRFSKDLFHDYAFALQDLEIEIQRGNGLIAQAVPNLCRQFPDWEVAVVQGTRDAVMSAIFGSITPRDHEQLVLGPQGIAALTADPNDNCSAFVPDTRVHVLLTKNRDLQISAAGTAVIDFARSFLRDGAAENLVDDRRPRLWVEEIDLQIQGPIPYPMPEESQ